MKQEPTISEERVLLLQSIGAMRARCVSYHFTDKPELTGQFDEAMAAIKFLTEI